VRPPIRGCRDGSARRQGIASRPPWSDTVAESLDGLGDSDTVAVTWALSHFNLQAARASYPVPERDCVDGHGLASALERHCRGKP